MLLRPPPFELTVEALHLLLALSLQDLLPMKLPGTRRFMTRPEPLELQPVALLKPLLFAPLPDLEVV